MKPIEKLLQDGRPARPFFFKGMAAWAGLVEGSVS
jgi:hypothetical protein